LKKQSVVREARVRLFAEQMRRELARVVELDEGWAHEIAKEAQQRLNAEAKTEFRTIVLSADRVTAFTVPGRYIYLSRELISRGLDEPGIAFVIAHEMAHHALGHLDSAGAAIESEGASLSTRIRTQTKLIFAAPIGPAEELAADRWAFELCRRAGYDERGAIDAFELIARAQLDFRRIDDALGGTQLDRVGGALGSWRSHPPTSERIEALRRSRSRGARATAAPASVASTALLAACEDCRARFARRACCPRCGSWAVFDLGDPLHRPRTMSLDPDRLALPFGTFVGIVVGFASATYMAIAWAVWMGLGAGALAMCGYVLKIALDERRRTSLETYDRLEPFAILPPPSGEVVRWIGRVHVPRPIESVVGRVRCAAFRVRGEGPSGPLDDVRATDFELRGPGVHAIIRGKHLLLELPVTRAHARVMIDQPLEDFLLCRATRAGAVIDVAEAALVEGDLVEVHGVIRRAWRGHAFRSSEGAVELRPWALVRKLEP
jgi:hypothetical protein